MKPPPILRTGTGARSKTFVNIPPSETLKPLPSRPPTVVTVIVFVIIAILLTVILILLCIILAQQPHINTTANSHVQHAHMSSAVSADVHEHNDVRPKPNRGEYVHRFNQDEQLD